MRNWASCYYALIKGSFVMAGLLVVGALSLAWAETVFGPQAYVRQPGPPQIISESFSVTDTSLAYKLVITNNGLADSSAEAVTDSFIYLNDNPLVGANNFNQATSTLEISVSLLPENTLEVEVRGARGGGITVQIVSNP